MNRKLPRKISEMTDAELLRVVGQGTDGVRIVLVEKINRRIPEALDFYKTVIDIGDGLLEILGTKTFSDSEQLIVQQWAETTNDMKESFKHIKL